MMLPEFDLPRSLRPTASAPRATLTNVDVVWIENRIEHTIRFGRIAAERSGDRHTRVMSFRPNAIFALLQQTTRDVGPPHARLDILRAVEPGEAYTTVPRVRPGGELYLSLRGWRNVQAVLEAIAAVEAAGVDPCDACPDHWRHVHNRLDAGQRPRLYTAERHAAYLKRKAIEQ